MGKIYAEDAEKIKANRARAVERAAHNKAVDAAKQEKYWKNREAFVPRKASHKQGHKARVHH